MPDRSGSTYLLEFLLVLGGLYLPWFSAWKIWTAVVGGTIYLPLPPFFAGPVSRREHPFSFWTAAMYWTVLAVLFEGLLVLSFLGIITGRGS